MTGAETEAPILWPPDGKSQLTWKDPNAGKDWGQEEEGMTGDEMVEWYNWHSEHELSKLWETLKDRKAWHAAVQGDCKELDMTKQLNNTTTK